MHKKELVTCVVQLGRWLNPTKKAALIFNHCPFVRVCLRPFLSFSFFLSQPL